jgi:hypothetical protein
MDSEPFSPLQGSLAFQRFGRPAEYVPSALASGNHINRSRSLKIWLERFQVNQTIEKEKIMKETIIIPMVVAVAVGRAIIAEEDAEDAEEAEEVAAEEAFENN